MGYLTAIGFWWWFPVIATSALAAYRTRGVLRLCMAYTAASHIAFWVVRNHSHWHVYDPLWRVAEPVAVILAGGATLALVRGLNWRVALPALAVHCWAAGYPQRWPGSWLEAEIHAAAFCYLVFGLALLPRTCKDCLQVASLAALFLGTAAAYYPAPWAAWVRLWLMYWQAACFAALAVPERFFHFPIAKV